MRKISYLLFILWIVALVHCQAECFHIHSNSEKNHNTHHHHHHSSSESGSDHQQGEECEIEYISLRHLDKSNLLIAYETSLDDFAFKLVHIYYDLTLQLLLGNTPEIVKISESVDRTLICQEKLLSVRKPTAPPVFL